MRHRWSEPSRPSHLETVRTCERCGILRVTHHAGRGRNTEIKTTNRRFGLNARIILNPLQFSLDTCDNCRDARHCQPSRAATKDRKP